MPDGAAGANPKRIVLFVQTDGKETPLPDWLDKRRLPESQLVRRGIPGYVGEWVLDSVVPGAGSLTPGEAHKVQEWAAQEWAALRRCVPPSR